MPQSAFVSDVSTKQEAATDAIRAAAESCLGDVYRRLEAARLQ
jgi:hypothetical protein